MTSAFPSSFPGREEPFASTHSFIVKIWLEEITEEGKSVWRGHMVHVPSNRKEYFARVEDIPTLISPYLQSDAYFPAKAPQTGGLFHWIKHLTRRFPRSQSNDKQEPEE